MGRGFHPDTFCRERNPLNRKYVNTDPMILGYVRRGTIFKVPASIIQICHINCFRSCQGGVVIFFTNRSVSRPCPVPLLFGRMRLGKPQLTTDYCPSINEIRGTGEFPIRKCEFSCKAREIKGLCGGVYPVRRTCLRACLSRPDARQATHRQAGDSAD